MAHQGPFNPSSANQIATGSIIWTSPGNILSSNNQYATAQLSEIDIQNTHTLTATGFGFSVPTGSTITGVEALIERRRSGTGNGGDNSVRLIVAGSLAGDSRAIGGNWPFVDSVQAYGGESDSWGLSLTPAQVNAGNFGIGIAAFIETFAHPTTLFVDNIKLIVYFTDPSGGQLAGNMFLVL